MLKSAISGAVLDELRDGPLDKHGGGSRILDVTRTSMRTRSPVSPASARIARTRRRVERGLNAKEIVAFMKANIKRAGDQARWYFPMLMKGEWPVLLEILGKGEGDDRYLSVAEVRTLFVDRRFPARIVARLQHGP